MKKSLRNHRIFFHRMGLLFLFIPLVVLIIGIVLPDRGFSEKENRVLSSRPHLNGSQIASGGFEKQFETYENDQFPLRDLWITLKAGTDRLMGKVEDVADMFQCGDTVTPEWNINIIPEPASKRNMPTAPEFGYTG